MGQQLSSLPSPFAPSDPSLRVNVNFATAVGDTDAGTKECLERCAAALTALGSYKPQPAPIREAISKPHDYDIAVAAVVALIDVWDL